MHCISGASLSSALVSRRYKILSLRIYTFSAHQDIVMTLKEKLSLSRIEHFSLVLEQQHSISKLLLLHDEERIQQVRVRAPGADSLQGVWLVSG